LDVMLGNYEARKFELTWQKEDCQTLCGGMQQLGIQARCGWNFRSLY
jgi:hypothetical protein